GFNFIIKQITIYNCIGQKVEDLENLSGNEITVSLKNFLPGIHFFELITTNNQSLSGKFLVKK
nr:T9SS type A sorting domain-containing protein [Bacteroidota bacterium]